MNSIKRTDHPRGRAAFAAAIRKLLEREKFTLLPKERTAFWARVRWAPRYVFGVGQREEQGHLVERFLKIPVPDDPKIWKPFFRQLQFAEFLKADGRIKTRGVVAANMNRKKGLAYAIMETFPLAHSRIGFIANHKDTDRLGAREARSTIAALDTLHHIPAKATPPHLRKLLVALPADFNTWVRKLKLSLNKPVQPLDGRGKTIPFHQVLEHRLHIPKFKEQTLALVEHVRPLIEGQAKRGAFLYHGDMAPVNLYIYNSGDIELLDLEWVGGCANGTIAIIHDFGNLRARAWSNERFRQALDAELLAHYRRRGEERLGKAIIALSILRSHIMLAGFFENYDWSKQRRPAERTRRTLTERDIPKAWKLLGLKLR